MPTYADWEKLIDECTWAWKTTDDGYAVNGFLVTGPNGKTIFLPAAGFYTSAPARVGLLGLYWSSSLHDTNSRQAFLVEFDGLVVRKSSQTRETGSSVRPVSD